MKTARTKAANQPVSAQEVLDFDDVVDGNVFV